MKKKPKIKRIVMICLAVAVAGVVAWLALKPKPEVIVYQRAVPLSTMDLRNTVDVTGNVESEDSVSVYSAVSQEVIEIAVEVGDKVEEGDLLCRMDTSSIESDITTKQADISQSQRSNQLGISEANTDLYYAQWYLEHQQNSNILSAQQAVEEAERALKEAQFAIRSAEDNYDSARKDNKDAKDDGDDPEYSTSQMNALRDAVSQAYLGQEAAEANLEAAKQKLNRAKWDADAALKEAQNALTKAQLNADLTTEYIALEKLREDLLNCTITAPVAGTVTAVYAAEGADAKGLMFVIENTDDLVVETMIKEFDVNTVYPGMKVQVKSDATGEEVFEGELLSIEPASVKDTDGNTITGSTAEYAARVRVTSKNTGLRIGMNVRLNIIVEEKENRLAVLYDSVTTDAQGNSIVYVAKQQEDGSYTAQAVQVETGMETDLYLEVSGAELAEGDLILQDVMLLYDGMPVNIAPEAGGMEMMAGGGGMAQGGATVIVG